MIPALCTTILTLVCLGQMDEAASKSAGPWTIVRDGSEVTIEIPSEDGIVNYSTVAAVLAEVADLDGDVLNDAISFGEMNLAESRTRWGLRGLNLALPEGIHFRAVRGDDDEWRLRIDLDLEELDESTREWRRQAREWVTETIDGNGSVVHGLTWHAAPTAPVQSKIVILVHGYTCNGATMCPLADALTSHGYHCGVLDYPNDGPVIDTAEFLKQTLDEDERLSALLAEDGERSVTLVTHSMGGLAARWMLEHPEMKPAYIGQIIMIAPPSQGSNIAYLPGALDVFDHWLLKGEFDPLTFIEGSFADGLDEAHHDLRPNSRFLRELNACPRSEGVEYTIVLGTDGVVSETGLAVLREGWDALCEESRSAQFIAPRIDAILDDPQELMDGQGDGLVAISRGRLEGVDDTVLLHFHHGTLCRDLASSDGQELVGTILDRLYSDN